MNIFDENTDELSAWIREEVVFDRLLEHGNRGKAVRRVQEWLCLHGFGLQIDGDFGNVTERVLRRFQEHHAIDPSGLLDQTTFEALVEPMLGVLRQRVEPGVTPQRAVLAYAKAHLDVHAREIGGENMGPWVRLYMSGHEGRPFAWCAGFVTFIMHQACQSLAIDTPVPGSISCDTLAAQARQAGLFVSERDATPDKLGACSVFLSRRTATDWTHTGIVTSVDQTLFTTIEGNTNDEGSREGFEVCARSRGFRKKDFFVLAPLTV